jgi:hypothetical protein
MFILESVYICDIVCIYVTLCVTTHRRSMTVEHQQSLKCFCNDFQSISSEESSPSLQKNKGDGISSMSIVHRCICVLVLVVTVLYCCVLLTLREIKKVIHIRTCDHVYECVYVCADVFLGGIL